MSVPIIGYLDRFSVRPGGTLAVKVSSVAAEPYEARLVRIRCADPNPAGPGMQVIDLGHVFSGRFPSRPQTVTLGSYGRVPHAPALDCNGHAFTWSALVRPSLLTPEPAAILAKGDPAIAGVRLLLSTTGVAAEVATAAGVPLRAATGQSLRRNVWYRVWLACDPASGRLQVGQAPLAEDALFDPPATASATTGALLLPDSPDALLIGAAETSGRRHLHLEARVEAPTVLKGYIDEPVAASRTSGLGLVAAWDFGVDIGGSLMHDRGPHALHGRLHNMPTRGVRGAFWTGREMCWRHAPADYAAVQFHADDIDDCGWATDFTFTAPDDMKSGIYGIQLTCAGQRDTIPFYVRPKPGAKRAPVLFMASTFTYQAYANHARRNLDTAFKSRIAEWGAYPWNTDEHPDFGASTYNRHPDNSGICYSSRARPILTMRPGYLTFDDPRGSGCRHFVADTHIVDWLEAKGLDYDIETDEDIDDEGAALLAPYRAVLTGSHPEYHTGRTLDAIQAYKAGGGRLCYLGGNGFYWRIARDPARPHLIEVRRAEGGVRAWAAEPGEYYHTLDGQHGGMWRRNMRAPQSIGGVGFTTQGLFEGTHYRRTAASRDERFAWLFAGIEGDIIGDFGLSGGGAAGFELDRADLNQGTPPNAVVLARSEQHPASFTPVVEEILSPLTTIPGEPAGDLVRAEIVYYDLARGGAVFAVGSITFCGSLSHHGYTNNVSRLLENVLRRFIAD